MLNTCGRSVTADDAGSRLSAQARVYASSTLVVHWPPSRHVAELEILLHEAERVRQDLVSHTRVAEVSPRPLVISGSTSRPE